MTRAERIEAAAKALVPLLPEPMYSWRDGSRVGHRNGAPDPRVIPYAEELRAALATESENGGDPDAR